MSLDASASRKSREGIKVFGWPAHKDELIWHPHTSCYEDKPTHIARVVDVQNIESLKVCGHLVLKDSNGAFEENPKCLLCEKQLQIKFIEVEE